MEERLASVSERACPGTTPCRNARCVCTGYLTGRGAWKRSRQALLKEQTLSGAMAEAEQALAQAKVRTAARLYTRRASDHHPRAALGLTTCT